MLWQKAQRLTLILVDAFYSRNECCCNPSVGLKRGSHICVPLRQLAMCFHRLSMVPFAPTTITEELLTQILTPRLPRAQRFLLEQLLTNRQFTALWQEEGVLAILRGTCIFCGAGHTPPDLILHLREEHSCQHIMFHFYAAQLIDVVHDLQPDIFQCSMCTQIFNLPWTLKPDEPAAARLDLAQSHLKGHCPVLTQLALLFSALLHGHHNLYANHGSGGGGAGDRGIFSTGPTLPRQFPEAGTQPEGHQATQKRNARSDRKTSTASRSRSARGTAGDATGTHHGQLDHQARSGTSKSAQNGSIHSFFEQRTSGRFASPGPGIQNLETEDGGIDASHAVSAAASDHHPPEGAEATSRADCPSEGHRGAVSDVSTERIDPERSELPLPQVGPCREEAGPGQEDPDQRSQDGAAPGRTIGNAARSVPGDSISFSETSQSGSAISPMAPPVEPSERQTIRALSSSGSQFPVDAGGGIDEAPFPGPIGPGHGSPIPDERQGQGQGQTGQAGTDSLMMDRGALLTILCGLQLTNDSSWCYANSIVCCLLWLRMCVQPTFDAWGCRYDEITSFFCQCDSETVALADAPWFCQILRRWGPVHGQNDSAEFTQAILDWIGATAINMRWERRVAIHDVLQVFDSSNASTPITLTITDEMHHSGHCDLSHMLQHWAQENSMSAALTQAPVCICLHIDRYFQSSDGTIVKSNSAVSLDTEVSVPIFVAEGLQSEMQGYIPIAGTTHFGEDLAGHCQAVLKLQPGVLHEVQPIAWLITNDMVPPQPTWHIPAMFAQTLTVIWLVRTDCLSLPLYPMPRANAAQMMTDAAATQDLLMLLQAHPGANCKS